MVLFVHDKQITPLQSIFEVKQSEKPTSSMHKIELKFGARFFWKPK